MKNNELTPKEKRIYIVIVMLGIIGFIGFLIEASGAIKDRRDRDEYYSSNYSSNYSNRSYQSSNEKTNYNSRKTYMTSNIVDYHDEGVCSHGSCTRKRTSGSRYCKMHTCKEQGCFNEVGSANDRCSKHKKEYYDEMGIGDKPDVKNCAYSGCDTDAYRDSNYCVSHMCRQSGCNNGVWGGSGYCYEHCPH